MTAGPTAARWRKGDGQHWRTAVVHAVVRHDTELGRFTVTVTDTATGNHRTLDTARCQVEIDTAPGPWPCWTELAAWADATPPLFAVDAH